MKRLPALLLPATLLVACSGEPAPAPGPAAAPAPAAPGSEAAPATAGLPADQVPRAFLCRGNEPFWSLDIGVGGGLLKTPEGETVLEGKLAATGTGAWTFRGAPVDEPATATNALLSPAQCFDTMADGPALPYSAVVDLPDGRQGSGCCSAEYGLDLDAAPALDAAAKPADDWSRLWPDLGRAVLRCTYDAGVATESVTKAWPMNHGKATVRLRDTGNARFDCLVDLGELDIESVAPVADGDVAPGEGQPRWLPARDTPPVLHCGRVERVSADGDLVLGWLHYPDGC